VQAIPVLPPFSLRQIEKLEARRLEKSHSGDTVKLENHPNEERPMKVVEELESIRERELKFNSFQESVLL
jgi:hypothetical protein